MKVTDLPKKYQSLVKSFTREYDLIDNCKYLMYLNDGVRFAGELVIMLPVKNKRDAVQLLSACTL